MLPVAAFELGNVATTLLIPGRCNSSSRGGLTLTAATSLAVLIYAAHNAFGAVVAVIGGTGLNRAGPRVVFASAALLYVVAYSGFAIPHQSWWTAVDFPSRSPEVGSDSRNAESTLVARAVPDELPAVVSACSEPSRPVATSPQIGSRRLLYAVASPVIGFAYAAAWMLVALAGSVALRDPCG